MIIKKVTVQNFGIIDGPITINFARDLHVVEGENECGKSTVARALTLAFTMRSKTGGRFLDSIRPQSGANPRVSVEFEVGRRHFSLTKTFKGAGGTSELRESDAVGHPIRLLNGDAAEAELRAVVEMPEVTGRGEPRPGGIWQMFWMVQGSNLASPDDAWNDQSRSRLTNYLASQTDQFAIGPAAEAVVTQVSRLYESFYTGDGKVRTATSNELKVAETKLPEAVEVERALGHRLREWEDLNDKLLSNQVAVERLRESLPQLVMVREHARARVADLKQTENDLRTSQMDARMKQSEWQSAVAELNAHELRLSKLTEGDQRLKQCESAIVQARCDLIGQTTLVERARQSRADAEGADQLAQRQLDEHTRAEAAQRHDDEIRTLATTLHHARATAERIGILEESLSRLRVTPEQFHSLTNLLHKRERAAGAVEMAAARVEVTAKSDFILTHGSARPLSARQTWGCSASEPTRIGIGDLADIVIIPGGAEVADQRRVLSALEQQIAALLTATGCDSLATARVRLEEKTRTQDQLRERRARLAEILGGRPMKEVEDRLRAAELRSGRGAAEVLALPRSDSTEIWSRRASAAARAQQTAQRLAAIDRELETLRLDEVRLGESVRAAVVNRDRVVEEMKAIAEVLDPAPDAREQLTEKARQLDTLRLEAERTHADISAAVAAARPDDVRAEFTRRERAVEGLEREIGAGQIEAAGIKARLLASDLVGLHERHATAQAELDLRRAEHRRVAARAEAIRMLHAIVGRHRREAHARYQAPLQAAVSPLITRMYGPSTVRFDNTFQLQDIARGGTRLDTFERLSGGAREQLNILLRLGLAKLMGGDEPIPILLDDALTWTDDDRFERMVPILLDAARTSQILIFTCHWSKYRNAMGPRDDQVTHLRGVIDRSGLVTAH